MIARRFRMADMLLVVAFSAFGALIARDSNPYTRSDPTYILAPVSISLVLACLVLAAISARFGPEDLRASRWGFVLGCGAYLLMSQRLGFEYTWQPVASELVKDGLGAAGTRLGAAGWTPASDLVTYLGFTRGPMMFG